MKVAAETRELLIIKHRSGEMNLDTDNLRRYSFMSAQQNSKNKHPLGKQVSNKSLC